MRKVINSTLMTVAAIALLGLQTVAFGNAPVISGMPNIVVVGDAEVTTPDANYFVYPDAFDLSQIGSDESVLPENLIWTYGVSTGTSDYLLNGVPAITIGTDDPQTIAFDDPRVINNQANVRVSDNLDGNPMTVTVRNNVFTPIDTLAPYPGTATPGVQDEQILTLFCSDGSAINPNFSSVDATFKSDQGGNDRLNNDPRVSQVVRQLDFVADGPGSGTAAWTSGDVVGSATFSTTNGLSINAPLLGDNFGIWSSPDSYISLVANSLWRLRMTVTSDQTTPYAVPLWDVIIENSPAAGTGPFAYGLDYFFLDNAGGANAAGPVGRTDFQVWYTPAPIQTAQFSDATNGAFGPALDTLNDMRVRFRVLDAGSAAINADFDSGTLSLQNLEIDRFDLTAGTPTGGTATSVLNASTITDGEFGASAPTDFTVTFIEGTVVDFAGGHLSLTPETAAGWGGISGAEVIQMQPGDGFFNTSTGFSIADNFPVTWEANTLYRLTVNMQSLGATGDTNPPDLTSFIFDTPLNELTCSSYITPGMIGANGLPVATARSAAADYYTFFYSHGVSRTAIASLKAIRPLVQIISVNSLVLGGITTSTGGVQINSVKVDKFGFSN